MIFSFNFKKDLFPFLEGFVDIHCHVLPGLDDGAKDMGATRRMLEEYHKLGFKEIIATPHVMRGSYPNTPKSIRESFDGVKEQIKNELNLISGFSAEYMLDENFEENLKANKLLPLKKKYVLIEMSYFQKPVNLTELIFQMEHQGYLPVLAHPERYNFIKSLETFRDLKKRGCRFQLNLMSLSKHYGSQVQKKAAMLLKNDLYDFAATDAHSLGHLKQIAQISFPKKFDRQINKVTEGTKTAFLGK